MASAIALVAAGFLGGVILTGMAACYLYGLLHAEAVRVLEGEGALRLASSGQPRAASAAAPRPSRTRSFTPSQFDRILSAVAGANHDR